MAGRAVGAAFLASELDDLEAVVASLAHLDVTGVAEDALPACVVAVERIAARLDALRAHLQVELDERDWCDGHDGMRTGAWIGRETHTGTKAANRRLHVARRLLDEFPVFDAALAEGLISWTHVEQLCSAANPRVAEYLAQLQGELVDLIPEVTFGEWRRRLLDTARRLDQDGPAPRQPEPDRLYLDRLPDGRVHLEGTFSGTNAAKLTHLLDTATDRRWRLARDTAALDGTDVPARPELRALALLDLASDSASAATHAEVVLHTKADDPGWFTTGDGHTLHATDLACELCDAAYQLLTLDPHGLPLDLGRTQRLATPAQRKAAFARDGGCVFPGCDTPARWCDLHHLLDWLHGGCTDLANLATLCRHHHGVTHRSGWTMLASGDGTFRWTTPNGHTLHSQRHHQLQRAGP